MSPEQESEYLTVAEAVLWLGISRRTFERWVADDRIPYSVTPDGKRLFRLADLLERTIRTPLSGPEEREESTD